MAVADVVTTDQSGDLDILFCDMNGNLVCIDRSGDVLWDRQLAGGSSATPTVGDVDGDGRDDLLVGTVTPEASEPSTEPNLRLVRRQGFLVGHFSHRYGFEFHTIEGITNGWVSSKALHAWSN